MIKIKQVGKSVKVMDPRAIQQSGFNEKEHCVFIVECSDGLFRETSSKEVILGEASNGHQIYCRICADFFRVIEKDGKFVVDDPSHVSNPEDCGHVVKGC